MPIWKIANNKPIRVSETKPKQEKLLEEHLEDWIIADPSLLGEPLLIIGRQVIIPGVKDRLDILALDPQGKGVVIELKRGGLKEPVDMQGLRYASYISKWRFQDFESQARAYLGGASDANFNFNELYEQFCTQAGVDEVPNINTDQRIILVGSEVKEKLGSVALWLREHNVDIKVIEIAVYKEGESILVRPDLIIPLPVSRFATTGSSPLGDASQPWINDGRVWHLEKRCSPETREMLLRIDDIIRDNFDVDGPRWDQKFYVAYQIGNNNWLTIDTRATVLRLRCKVKAGTFKQAELAQHLGVEEFDTEETQAEKLNLSSSLVIKPYSEGTERVILRMKKGFNLEGTEFLTFLKEAHKTLPK